MREQEAFIAIVEAGNYTAASRELNLSVAVLSRRIKRLEQRLGVRLLQRTTRKVTPTDSGWRYYEVLRETMDTLAAAEHELSEAAETVRGRLRIGAPMSFTQHRLAEILANFVTLYPDVQIELDLDDAAVDIVERGIDVAIRIGRLDDSQLIGRPLGLVPRVICASPRYLDRHRAPRRPADLRDHACLRYSLLNEREEWTLSEAGQAVAIPVNGVFCCNNGDVLAQAACSGLGLVLLPEFLVASALATGDLVRVLEGYEPKPFELFALYPSRHHLPTKTRVLIEHLTQHLRA